MKNFRVNEIRVYLAIIWKIETAFSISTPLPRAPRSSPGHFTSPSETIATGQDHLRSHFRRESKMKSDKTGRASTVEMATFFELQLHSKPMHRTVKWSDAHILQGRAHVSGKG